MSTTVAMPALGESVTEGTVTRWLKQVGDPVAVDEPIVEVSTDKVDTEIPSPAAGVLLQIVAAEDATVSVGEPLAVIGAADEAPAETPEAPQTPDQGSEAGATPMSRREYAAAQGGALPPQPQPASAPQPPTPVAPEQPVAPTPADQQVTEPTPAGGPSAGAVEVTMPALGESVTEGTVTRWLKQVGDTVTADEPLLEVSTDKVDTEIPSPASGTLLEIVAAEDAVVEVGAVLARLGQPGSVAAAPQPPAPAPAQQAPEQEAAPAPAPIPAPPQAPATPPAPAPAPAVPAIPAPPAPAAVPAPPAAPTPPVPPTAPPAAPSAGASVTAGRYLTPLVRKLAQDSGVDVSKIAGTGVGGRVRREDVIAAAAASAPAATQEAPAQPAAPTEVSPAPAQAAVPEVSSLRGTTEKMSRLRKLVATRMVEALSTTAQLTTVVEVDVTRIAQLRTSAKDAFGAKHGVKLTFLPFFALATIEALRAYPKLNATISGDEVNYPDTENLGIAVDTERGLLVPVIRAAGEKSLVQLAQSAADLAARTRANKVSPDELSGGTFTLTNTGSIGALFDTPIVPQPQVGILGTGVITKRPVVLTGPDGGDTIAVRHMIYLALSYDHQLIDGADAGRFLQYLKRRLEGGDFAASLEL